MKNTLKSLFYDFCRPEEYKKKVAEYVKKYATEDALRETDKVPKPLGNLYIFWTLTRYQNLRDTE